MVIIKKLSVEGEETTAPFEVQIEAAADAEGTPTGNDFYSSGVQLQSRAGTFS